MTTGTADSVSISKAGIPVHLHIGEERLAAGSGGTHERISPITGAVDGTIPLAGKAEMDHAVEVAHEAFHTWRRTSPPERRELLLRLADVLEAHDGELNRLVTVDTASPYAGETGKQSGTTNYMRYYAGWADKYTSDVVGTWQQNRDFAYTLAQPYGVVGVIVGSNGPVGSIGMKVPAALAAGNTVVIKPPELTPYSPEYFMDLVREAGFPPGVINLLPGGAEAGAALVAHPLVKKVSFTGGPATARHISSACAAAFKPYVLELGGKSANIVFEDADLETACLHGAMLSVGVMAGQGCSFPSRMLVQRSRYDEAVERMGALAKSFVVGDPFDPKTVTGPVLTQVAVDRILGMVGRAVEGGARLVTGGARLGLPGEVAGGFFVEPTVLADVDPASEIAQHEVFGPVVALTPFEDEAEAIAIANGTEYGLAAYLRTRDVTRALRVAEQLDAGDIHVNGAGNLMVNRPFGGRGLSGVGKEGGRQGFEEFLQVKSIGIGTGEGPLFSFGS